MKKRLLSVLLILVLLFSLVPGTAVFAQTADGKPAEISVPVEQQAEGDGASLRAAKTKTVLTFTSDIHNSSNNTAANRLDKWLDFVAEEYGGIDAMGFCGDMGQASGSGSTWWGYVNSVMTVAENDVDQVVYTTGNHEFMNGSFTPTANAQTRKYIIGEEAINASDYRIFCLGTDNWDNYRDHYSSSQISGLRDYLNSTGTDKPIIILTHFPIHHFSSRTTDNADQVIDVLNAAADEGRTIVLLWGHNHTMSDSNYDQVFAPGSKVEYASGKTKEISFYHMAAGCMSDSEYNSASASVKGKGLVITIDSDKKLDFAYYDANGNNVTEDDSGNPPDNPGGGDDPTPSTASYYEIPDGDYYIESDDHYFLTTQAGDTYTNGGGSNQAEYNYVGLKGVADREAGQKWTFEKDEETGGYYIYVPTAAKAGFQYLNATYESNESGGYNGTLKVDETPDIWIIVSNGNGGLILKSTNASKTATEDKYLSHGNGSNSDSNTFTVRSNNSNNTATTIAYFDETGAEVKPTAAEGGDTPVDPTTGDTVSITPSTSNPEESIKINVGDTLTIRVTNGSSNSGYDYTATLSKSGIAEIQGNATITIAQGGTGTFVVKGIAEGAVDINIQNNQSSSQYARKGVIHLTVGEGGSTPVDPPSGDTVTITPSTDNPEESIKINVGDTLTVNVKNGSSNSAYDFTATSADTGIAAIQGNATINIAAGGTGTITVKGVAAGTVDITIQNENTYGSQYVRKGVIHLTVADSQVEPPTPAGDFSLEISGPETAEVNDEVAYKLDLSSDNYEKFAAADITLTYDTARLTVKTLPTGAEDSNGTIRLLDYGEDKDVGKAIYTFTFTAKADGNATVTVTKAAFLPGELAATTDMIDATLTAASITTEIGHDWGEAEWTWTGNDTDGYTAATVTYTCKNDPDHIYTDAATVTSQTTQPTATTAGKTVWTATAEDPSGNTVTDTKEVTLPATGYTYKDPVYTWTKETDTYKVTALKECNEDSAQNITETVDAVFSVTTAATCEAAGAGVWTATFTNSAFTAQSRDETIPALGHDWGAPVFDWAEDGSSVTATRTCANDAAHKESETVQTTSQKTKDPTCDQKGETTYTAVFQNAAFGTQTKVIADIDALGHDWGEATYAWTEGNAEVVATRFCGRDRTHVETEIAEATSKVTKEATCEEKGETTWTATFTNEAFVTQTKTEANIPALGHSWGEPTYVWADDNSTVTATRVCAHDAEHVQTEVAETTSKVTKEATCEIAGETTWTATFRNEAFTTQTKTEANLPAIGHDWDEPTYGWAADNSQVTAVRLCKNNSTHFEMEIAQATAEVTKPATCEAGGETTYTAVFTKEGFATQTKTERNLAPLGHDWGEPVWTWEEDYSGATATWTCAHDSSHVHKDEATVKSVKVDPTPEEDGSITYTATATGPADETVTDVKVVTLPASGYTYAEPTYEWLAIRDDTGKITGYKVIAESVCNEDENRNITEVAEAVYAVTAEPGCETEGEGTWTAAFRNTAFTTQTKKEPIPAVGHAWGEATYKWAEDNSSVTATRVCANDASHAETETAETAAEITKAATCEEVGETTYTAEFENKAFEKQTKTVADVPATGHKWGEPAWTWAEDYSAATATFVCGNDETHKETVEAVVTGPADAVYTATVTGPDGKQYTDTSAVFELTYDANGGTGEMEKQTGTVLTVSENAFVNEGSEFTGWNTAADGSGTAYAAGDTVTLTADLTLYAQWNLLGQKPEFRSQSLVLSGQIGLNFYLNLPAISGVDYEESYMEFTIGGKGGTTTYANFDRNNTNSSGKYYGFTCYVNSIQMADVITATFHYGNGQTVTKEYSVAQYIRFFDEHADSFNAKTIRLTHAIADFGHYAQIYLSSINDWTIGKDYAEMSLYYAKSYDFEALKPEVQQYAFAKDLGSSKVTKATYKLHLDSSTTVDVFLTVPKGTALTASTTYDGKTYKAELQSDGRYMIRIPDISAHKLGETITIRGNAGGSFTVAVSALSYVRSVLNNANAAAAEKNGLAAFYEYYRAVQNYRGQ